MQLKPNRERASRRANAGFTLMEVLVALLVVSIGLLGLAKMQAAAVSNTQVSRVRSLIAMQTASLSAAMQGNRAYWLAGFAPATFSASAAPGVPGFQVVDATNVLNGTTDCKTVVCTPAQLAAYDVNEWARNMSIQFPTYNANVKCSVTGTPVDCSINVTWAEKYVAINRTTAANTAAQTATQSFTLYVEP